MTINSFSIKSAVLITLSLSLAQGGAKTTGKLTPDEAKQTLEDLRNTATSMENQADELRMLIVYPQLSPESHSEKLMALKDEINRMGREISVLEANLKNLTPWEQQAVAKTFPLLKDSAANTENAIEYFNAHKTQLWTPVYHEYADYVLQDSEQMAKTLNDYLKLAKLREHEQPLESSLGLAGGGSN